MRKNFYIIYKTTIITTGQYYIGKHETNNLNDKYFGSSDYVKNYIKKYGYSNLTKEILSYCDDNHQMSLIESLYIRNHIGKNLCLNKAKGISFFEFLNQEEKNKIKSLKADFEKPKQTIIIKKYGLAAGLQKLIEIEKNEKHQRL